MFFHSISHIAPNIYKIPSVLGSSREGPIRSAPAFSMTSRQKQKLPMCAQFPGTLTSIQMKWQIFNVQITGPGTYESNFEPLVRKQPTYSMATRFKIPTDENQKPGPAQHHHERVRVWFECFKWDFIKFTSFRLIWATSLVIRLVSNIRHIWDDSKKMLLTK